MARKNNLITVALILLICGVVAFLVFFIGKNFIFAAGDAGEDIALPIAQPELSGSLAPDSGPVIAVIDGEEFHYNHVALLFRDLLRYPEKPFTVMAGRDAGVFATYAEQALALELAYRAAVDEGDGDYRGRKKDFADRLATGVHFDDVDLTGGQDIVAAVKAEFALGTTAELAELTYPIRQKGEVADAYFHNYFREKYGLDSDELFYVEEEDLVALYQTWLDEYRVEVIPLQGTDGVAVDYMARQNGTVTERTGESQ